MSAETFVDLRLVLDLSDPVTHRRLTILQSIQGGQPMANPAIRHRFGVSRATATRDLTVVRRAIDRART